ncbi:PDZ domain-containing protein MAGIX isoform X2 [Elephas maximus indicus]|uniref:PDZ domain-containing protein MAGIX isoform X2 n=1 Tax=Elephas maximus indicus TaxID=99487 RepID=UPI002117098E|nr:PDZ domain-containing protein MAGIX isoform X2 [Elephas maximus indicus]
MEARAGGAADRRGSRGGRGLPLSVGPSARQLLAPLDARPLATRATADVAALVRRAGATLRLRHKEGVSRLDSADIEVTDSCLPQAPVVRHQCQAGDLVLHINGESTHGLTQAQVAERIRSGGPRLRLVLRRPFETHPGKPEGLRGPQKRVLPFLDRSLDPRELEVRRSCSASASPLQHPGSRTTARTQGLPEPSSEAAVSVAAVSPSERHTEDPDDQSPSSPGPWLLPSEERLSRALGVPRSSQLALETAAARQTH